MSDDLAGHIERTPLAAALSERYLAYAMSTIVSRSLPDVRDGLKPVHRRLVYAMQQLRLDPEAGFKKCARVVGDVIGRYHPHGDTAVYEALVRLAQDFAVRYPLVEGQGNFGNIDGDNAAAMRYTEARLTAIAGALLAGLEDDAVDFRPTYSGEDQEPVVLPASFPNLLANGAAGIAVGMATSIPPHNLGELCRAATALIENPDCSIDALLAHVGGPDFPTGGVLVEEPAAIRNAYETGRGAFRLRARWHKEEGRFGTWIVVVTEIPYQVQKARLIEQVAELLEAKKLPLLADIRDESAETVRLVLEPRSRTIEPAVLMETMFRATALETRFPLNMNVLGPDRTPRVMGLREVLRHWLDHRHEVLERRSRHRLAAVVRRLEILEGFIKVYLDLDRVIRIIREEDDAKAALVAAFGLTEVQVEAVLNMRLRSLRRLEEMEIRREHAALDRERAEIERLLDPANARGRWKRIRAEIAETGKRFGSGKLGDRRTEIGTAPATVEIAGHEHVERERITVLLSRHGWIRAARGHDLDLAGQRFKEGDELAFHVACETTDRLSLFASNGRIYTLKAADIPRGRGDGQPIRTAIELGNDEGVLALFVHDPQSRRLVAGSGGRGFVVQGAELLAEKRTGKTVLNLRPGERAAFCLPATGDHVAAVGENRKLLIFPLDQLPEFARGAGVAIQRYKDGGLRDLLVFTLADGLPTASGKTRPAAELRDWIGGRAEAGRLAPRNLLDAEGRFANPPGPGAGRDAAGKGKDST